jgi:hypothetical protein
MDKVDKYVGKVKEVFSRAPNKHAAHESSWELLEEISYDSGFLTDALRRHLRLPGVLNRRHYPVVAIPVVSHPSFTMVLNCWIPQPDSNTNLSTKAIHHHGALLLTTTNIFGIGYEHWIFTKPELADPDARLFTLRLDGHRLHGPHQAAFVDSQIPHLPFYPSELTITLALWSNSLPTSWKDYVKKAPIFRGREEQLRRIAVPLGLAKALDIKVVQDFDFFPVPEGFKPMRERREFPLGPNRDYLYSLFHVIQGTGNESLTSIIEEQLRDTVDDRVTVDMLLGALKSGTPIYPRLSEGHTNQPHANFTKQQLQQSLTM